MKTTKGSTTTPNMGEIVISSIKKLMRNTGWTARTIVKFIKIDYKLADPKLNKKVSRALKRGVKVGLLEMERGRYRLNELSHLIRPATTRKMKMGQHQIKQRKQDRILHIRSRSPSKIPKRTYISH